MLKHFCDVCGKELTEHDIEEKISNFSNKQYGKVRFSLTAYVDDDPYGGDVCFDCIMDIIIKIREEK